MQNVSKAFHSTFYRSSTLQSSWVATCTPTVPSPVPDLLRYFSKMYFQGCEDFEVFSSPDPLLHEKC